MVDPQSTQTVRDNLLYIRKTMEAAGQITAVPGWCLLAAGVLSLAGVAVNAFITGAPWGSAPYPYFALATWSVVLFVSVAIVSAGMYRKSRETCAPIQPPLLRKLLWSLCPGLFVGGLLTGIAVRTSKLEWLPVIWLGCYGAAVTNGGQVSVSPVRYMGLCFLIAAAGATFSPPGAGLIWLALGFGWIHIIFGAYIARRHNG
jgi:hypothetical protein